MKKILVTMLFVCFAFVGMMAKTNRELIIESTTKHPMPRGLVEKPRVYQCDAALSISLPQTASYVSVSTINKETGGQVYMMAYAMVGEIQIDLSVEETGEYVILLCVDGAEYAGDFVL